MADEIGVSIVATDQQFAASAGKAAAAVEEITRQEEKLAATSKELGVDNKKFAQQFGKVERDRIKNENRAQSAKAQEQKTRQKDIARQAARDAKEASRAEKKAAADEKKATEDRTSKNRQLARVLLGRRAVILGEATGIGTAVVAGIELASALAAAGTAATILLAAIAAVSLEASTARDNARGFMGVLTHGRGAEALADVDHLAGDLGEKFQDARDNFIKFRQAGLDNTQSAHLEKLVADLDTVDRSGELAKQAISRVLSYTSPGGRQTAEQVDASRRAMALLAKQAGVSGKGIEAAADSVSSISGAFNRIDNSKTQALEEIGDRIRPGVSRAAQAVAKLTENFLASEGGQKVIGALVDGIDSLSDSAEHAAKSMSDGLNDPDVRAGLDDLSIAIKGTADLIGFTAEESTALAVAIFGAVGKLSNLEGDALLWAENMIDGLIDGIEHGAHRVYDSVGDLAKNIGSTFAGLLGIHSPSKLFFEYGVDTGEGYAGGAEKSFPDGADIAQQMLPAPGQLARAAQAAAPAESASGGSPFGFGQPPIFGAAPGAGARTVQVTIQNIQLNVPAGEDPDRWMRAAGREIGLGIQAILMTQGAPSDG